MNDIHIPIGLCQITYGGAEIKYLAEKADFNAIPTYVKVYKGFHEPSYLLSDYKVSFSISLAEENYKNIQLSAPFLQSDGTGFYDNPGKVNGKGLPLIIHPYDSGDSKEYDILIFNAIPDPENPYKRTYDKTQDSISVSFIGLPSRKFSDNQFKSYFYIGDWEKAGVLNA